MAQAQLGYVGYVSFDEWLVRATTCDLKVTQSIDKPDLVDGKTDKTVWQLGPKEVGGGVAFPGIHELQAGKTDGVVEYLWKAAVERNADGRMVSIPNVNVKYTSGIAFEYTNCIIDSYEFSVTHSDVINLNVNILGKSRNAGSTANPSYQLRNTRVLTWNDATILFRNAAGTLLEGNSIRAFTATLTNNAARYYTLNQSLFPEDLAPTKRDFDGTVTVMGRNTDIADLAWSNFDRCTADSIVRFGYTLTSSTSECGGTFTVELPGVVFEIEELGITNDLFETTVTWHALPGIVYGAQNNQTNFITS